MSIKTFDEVFEDQTKYGTKIKTDEYCVSGAHIIVDQGQEQIAGYTDLEEGLFEDVPAIVFGDHTRIIKYVDTPFFLGADGVKVLRSRFIDANYKYLYYALKNARIPNTGYNRHFKWLKETQINYLDNKQQEEIVCILDRITEVIDKRQQQLSALDDLIKARFVEMFGRDNYPCVALKDITEVITKGTTPTTAGFVFVDNGINFFKIESIMEDHTINLEKVAHVTEECHKAFKRSQLRAGDILFSIAGAIGRTAIITERDLPGNTNQALAIIRLFSNSDLSRRFLISSLESPLVSEQYNRKKRGIAQINLSLQDIGNLIIPVPNKNTQDEFERFVQQVDKSKVVIQKALNETQLLFDSLMRQYFG